jgi:putative oxidoreductase
MKKVLHYGVWSICVAIGVFFAYKGIIKHWVKPCKVYSPDTTVPQEYISVITALCHSGYLKMIGFWEVLGGIFLIIRPLRVFGLMILLPVSGVILSIHGFLDNRPEELVEIGVPMAGLLLILWFEMMGRKQVLQFFTRRDNP